MSMRVGYIGLGAMGGQIARRLLAEGRLTVWDRSAAAVAELAALGAVVVGSAAEMATCCDVIVTCLPRSADVRHVIFGPGGLAEGLTQGQIIIDQTSGIPAETIAIAAELAGRGVAMLDAPISGSPAIVVPGRHTVMASGPDAAYAAALPVLQVLSPNLMRCGPRIGDGQAMKTINNALNACTRLALLEAAAAARACGLALETITEVVNLGAARSQPSTIMLPAIIEGRPWSNFGLALQLKDLTQAISLGFERGVPMPIAQVARGLLQIGVNLFGKDARLADVAPLIERLAGTRLVDDAAVAPPAPVPSRGDAGRSLRVGQFGPNDQGAALARLMSASPASTDFAAVAREHDVILLCPISADDLRRRVLGPDGLAEGLAPGKIIVDLAIGDPATTRALAGEAGALGVSLVDIQVLEGTDAVPVAVLCGGSPEDCATIHPLLAALAPKVVHCGEAGHAQAAWLLARAIADGNRVIACECAAVAVAYGLDLGVLAGVIQKSSGWSAMFEHVIATLVSGGAPARTTLRHEADLLKRASEMAYGHAAPMLIAHAVTAVVEAGANRLGADASVDDLAGAIAAAAGIHFRAG